MNIESLQKAISSQLKEITTLNEKIEFQNTIGNNLIFVLAFLVVILFLGWIFKKYKLKNKIMKNVKFLERINSFNEAEKNIFMFISALVLGLIAGYIAGETTYYSYSSDFANGIRISKQEYLSITDEGDFSGVFTKFSYSYLVFISVLLVSLGIIYLLLKNNKPTTLLDEAQKTVIPMVIKGYRKAGVERNCAPTSKTSDAKIIEIYQTVISAFNDASKTKNERIPAVNLNYIALKFFQVYELTGEEGFKSHLEYEVEKYLNEGLREEYNRELELI